MNCGSKKKFHRVEVDVFYAALVLDLDPERAKLLQNGAPPSPDDTACLEKLRAATEAYILRKLSSNQSLYPSLSTVEVSFRHLQFGSNKPEPKFQVYWEGSAAFFFPKETVLPRDATPQRLFDTMGREFDHNRWLLDVLVKTLPVASPMACANQVQMKRILNIKEGGAVQLPPFYYGFACQPPPPRDLTTSERKAFAAYVQKEFERHLKTEWLSTFQTVRVEVRKTSINEEARKPDDRYNLYVQLDALASYSSRAPEPEDVFRILCLTMDRRFGRDFVAGIWAMGGPVFGSVMRQAIRICAWIDDDEADQEEEHGQEEEGGEQDDNGGEDDNDANDSLPDQATTRVHLEFNVSLVVKGLEGLPDEPQLRELTALMKAYFGKRLQKEYPERFLKFDSFEAPEPKFGTGRPLPRFNMIHQYVAVLVMKKEEDKEVDPLELLRKIVGSKVLRLMNTIKLLKAPWNQTREVTMGKGDYRKAPEDQIYGGTIDDDGHIHSSKAKEPKTKAPGENKNKKSAKRPSSKSESPRIPDTTSAPVSNTTEDVGNQKLKPKFKGVFQTKPEQPGRNFRLVKPQPGPTAPKTKEKIVLKPIPPKTRKNDDPSYISRMLEESEDSRRIEDGQAFERYDSSGDYAPAKAGGKDRQDRSSAKYQRPSRGSEGEKQTRHSQIRPNDERLSVSNPESEREFNPDEIVPWEKPEPTISDLELHMQNFHTKRSSRSESTPS